MRRILVIRHESAGCMNNMQALAHELGKGRAAHIEHCTLVLRSKVLIPCMLLLLLLMPKMPSAVFLCLVRILFKGDIPQGAHYDVLVSALGEGEAPAILLARYYSGIAHFHIGTPRRIARRHFQVIIANFGIEPKKGEIMLEQALTRLDAFGEYDADRDGLCLQGKIAALLVGGPAADVNFDAHYWTDLQAFIFAYAAQSKMRWVITTTPRTPVDVMKALQKLADENPHIVAHYSAYALHKKSFLHAYLRACHVAFVTAESVSMIADAMAYAIPVYAIGNPGMINNHRINGFLDVQRKHNTIQHVNICDIRDGTIPVYTSLVHRPKWSNSFWTQLKHLYPAVAEKLKIHANSCDR